MVLERHGLVSLAVGGAKADSDTIDSFTALSRSLAITFSSSADLGQLVVREVNGVARRFQTDSLGRLESDDSEHCSHEKAKLHYVDFFLELLDQIKL